jgi:hypothetical protein
MSQENARFFEGWMIVRLAVLAAAVLTIGGCDGDVDRDSYVQRNEAIRKSLPTFPDATLVSVEHSPNRRVEGDGSARL